MLLFCCNSQFFDSLNRREVHIVPAHELSLDDVVDDFAIAQPASSFFTASASSSESSPDTSQDDDECSSQQPSQPSAPAAARPACLSSSSSPSASASRLPLKRAHTDSELCKMRWEPGVHRCSLLCSSLLWHFLLFDIPRVCGLYLCVCLSFFWQEDKFMRQVCLTVADWCFASAELWTHGASQTAGQSKNHCPHCISFHSLSLLLFLRLYYISFHCLPFCFKLSFLTFRGSAAVSLSPSHFPCLAVLPVVLPQFSFSCTCSIRFSFPLNMPLRFIVGWCSGSFVVHSVVIGSR